MNKQKPFLLINHRSPAASSGAPSGISNYMLSLMRALLDSNHLDIGLVTSWRKEDIPEDIMRRLRSYTHQGLMKPRVFDVVRQAVAMPAIARKLGADVILNVDPIGTPRGAKARLTVVHDVYFKVLPDAFSKRERLFSDMIMRIMVAGSQSIICVSDRTKADLDRFYPAAMPKSQRIYGDACVGRRTPDVENLGAPRAGHILWVGKITANKNVTCLYQALRILADRGQSMPAVVVGNDLFGYAQAAERDYGQGLDIRRLGTVSDEELTRLYDGASCFVNTSTYEGFGMPVIEAQRSGIPVICSTGGAVAEVAGSGALTFDPGNPSELAGHLESLRSNEVSTQLVMKGFENAKRFSWKNAAAELEKTVVKICNHTR